MTNLIGFIVLSKKRLEVGRSALGRALNELVRSDISTLEEGFHGVVFSKDRPLQLHGLLTSYFELNKKPPPLTVIYSASNSEYFSAYKELKIIFDSVFFLQETTFRESLLFTLSKISFSKIFFLVDDILFIRPINFDQLNNIDPRVEILSLRLGTHLNYCYTNASKQKLPLLNKINGKCSNTYLLSWTWRNGEFDWAYPLSVDGNCFDTIEMLTMARLIDFRAPNTFEAGLQWFSEAFQDRKGLCFESAKIVNIPFNKVQIEANNLKGDVSAELLLKYWNSGLKIATHKYHNVSTNDAHQLLELYLEPR